jgi:hypothetical protein
MPEIVRAHHSDVAEGGTRAGSHAEGGAHAGWLWQSRGWTQMVKEAREELGILGFTRDGWLQKRQPIVRPMPSRWPVICQRLM